MPTNLGRRQPPPPRPTKKAKRQHADRSDRGTGNTPSCYSRSSLLNQREILLQRQEFLTLDTSAYRQWEIDWAELTDRIDGTVRLARSSSSSDSSD